MEQNTLMRMILLKRNREQRRLIIYQREGAVEMRQEKNISSYLISQNYDKRPTYYEIPPNPVPQ